MSRNKSESQTSIRPELHLSLPDFKLCEPTGMIIIKGIYHLFVLKKSLEHEDPQVEWGHLLSEDLIHWTDQPPLTGDPPKAHRHSGYVVFDDKNTSGLGSVTQPPLVAIYNLQGLEHSFHLQYSKDLGQKWEEYGKGSILDTKKARSRDPFIFWYAALSKWIMIITIPHEYKTQIYSSKNLIKWEMISDFGGHPSFNKKWSHAALIPCRSNEIKVMTKWILMVGISEGEIANRYFVGEFDGQSFKCDHALDLMLKIDHGKDFSAPTPCHGTGEHHTILFAQMNHLDYQDFLPTEGWKGMMTMPRELMVYKEADGSYRLMQWPTHSWSALRSIEYHFIKSSMTNEVEWDIPMSDTMEFDLSIDSHKGCTLEFDFGSKTKVLILWDVMHHSLSLDRTNKNLGFHPSYSSFDQVNVSRGHLLSLHIVLDKYSIEILINGGKASLTSLFFSPHALQRFRIIGKHFAAGGKVWHLKKI